MSILKWQSAILALATIVFGVAVVLSHGANAQTKTVEEKKTLLVAEPGHGAATLPFYAAIAKGFFAEEGLDVKMLTVDGGYGSY